MAVVADLLRDALSVVLLVSGCVFVTAGTVALLRFPDRLTRLHALTKADNLGLGLVVAGLVVQAPSVGVAAKLVLVWVLALAAAATTGALLAREEPPSTAAAPEELR